MDLWQLGVKFGELNVELGVLGVIVVDCKMNCRCLAEIWLESGSQEHVSAVYFRTRS